MVRAQPPPPSVTSSIDDSSYDILSGSDILSDEDARTISSGSSVSDESETHRMSDSRYRYDSDDVDTEAEDNVIVVDGHQRSQDIPHAGNARTEFSERMAESLLNSNLSELTVKPSPSGSRVLQDTDDEAFGVWLNRKLITSSKHAVEMLDTPTGRRVISVTLLAAAALLTSSLLSLWIPGPALPELEHVGAPTILNPPKTAQAPPHLPNNPNTGRAPAANDKNQLSPIYDTLDFLGKLTSSRSAQKVSSITTSSSSSTSVLSATPINAMKKPSLKNRPPPQPKLPESPPSPKHTERFYLFLNTGRITPFELGRKEKSSDRLGPYTKITGQQQKFKINFNPTNSKFSVAHVGPGRIRGATVIIISKDEQVLQKGHLNSPDSAIVWVPSVVPRDHLQGEVQVIFALPAESSFQVNLLDLPKQAFQWSTPPKKAAAVASDVVRRLTDALSIYVEPIRLAPPVVREWTRKAAVTTSAPIGGNLDVKNALVRAHDHATALVQSVGSQTLQNAAGTCQRLAAMNEKVVKALNKYSGDVIVAVKGKPRESLSRAQNRVKELREKVGRVAIRPRSCEKRPVQRKGLLASFGWADGLLA